GILDQARRNRREAVQIRDFQKAGWSGSDDAHFPEGIALSTVSVAEPAITNLSVPSISFGRAPFSGQERITVTAGLSNKGDAPLNDVPVTLSVDGHEIETTRSSVLPHTSASVAFAPFTLSAANVRGNVRAGSDPLIADNTFHFVLTPSAPVSLLIVDAADRSDASLFLSKALSIGTSPSFQIDVIPAARVTPAAFEKRAVVVLNDTAADIAVKPIFLPLVHQLVRYLGRYEAATSWFTVGQVLDLSARTRGRAARVVVSPSGDRVTQAAAGEGAEGLLELSEQGI